VRAKLSAQLPLRAGASAFAEYEQDTQDWDRRAATLGAEYRLAPRARAYGRHEFLTGLTSPYALDESQQRHATVFGIDANLSPDARVFSEYRADGLFGAREGEAALGLSNAWRLASGRAAQRLARARRVARQGPVAAEPGRPDGGDGRGRLRRARALEGLGPPRVPQQQGERRVPLDRRRRVPPRRALERARPEPVHVHGRKRRSHRAARAHAARLRLSPGCGLGRARPLRDPLRVGRLRLLAALAGDRVANIVSFHGAGPLGERALGSLAWAGRIAHEDGTATAAHWVHGRAAWALAPQWDAGLTASFLGGSGVRRPGVGAEVGRKLRPDLWLSFGYNLTGYADDELTGEEWTRSGVYLRVRARFDEDALRGGGGR
jgi:hypothetical protein